jgi:hypothetical protein
MADIDGDEPSDTMERRVSGGRVKLWVLLQANRWLVAGVVLAGFFAAMVVLGTLDPQPLRAAVEQKDPIETVFQALLTAIITGVTLVVTIAQLVLSQELGAVGDQQERMEEAMSFREDVEQHLDAPVSPPDPASFLQALVDASARRADDIDAAANDETDEAVRDRCREFAAEVDQNAREVSDRLGDAQFGTYEVLAAALDYNYSWKIYEARRLAAGEVGPISDETRDAIEAFVDVQELFGPAREHVKTLYFQWELIDLSRAVLYAAVPALVVTTGMILFVDDPATVTGTTLGVDDLLWVTSAAAAVALAPFTLLLSYILRIATVTKRTLAIGPLVLRTVDAQDRS